MSKFNVMKLLIEVIKFFLFLIWNDWYFLGIHRGYNPNRTEKSYDISHSFRQGKHWKRVMPNKINLDL